MEWSNRNASWLQNKERTMKKNDLMGGGLAVDFHRQTPPLRSPVSRLAQHAVMEGYGTSTVKYSDGYTWNACMRRVLYHRLAAVKGE